MAKMNRVIAAAVVMVGMSPIVAMPAWADDALPQDRAALLKINDAQLLLLNRAVRACDDLYQTRHAGNICVTMAVDQDVRQSDDEDLKKLHWALPRSERYNDKRGIVELQRVLPD